MDEGGGGEKYEGCGEKDERGRGGWMGEVEGENVKRPEE